MPQQNVVQACLNPTKLHNFDIFLDNLSYGLHRA